jgi:hypothetical protein
MLQANTVDFGPSRKIVLSKIEGAWGYESSEDSYSEA